MPRRRLDVAGSYRVRVSQNLTGHTASFEFACDCLGFFSRVRSDAMVDNEGRRPATLRTRPSVCQECQRHAVRTSGAGNRKMGLALERTDVGHQCREFAFRDPLNCGISGEA